MTDDLYVGYRQSKLGANPPDDRHEAAPDDPPYQALEPRRVPLKVWVWIGGILLSLLAMLLMVFQAQSATRRTPAPDINDAAGETIHVPLAPTMPGESASERVVADATLPPLPRVPVPMSSLPPAPLMPTPAPPILYPAPEATLTQTPIPTLDERRAGLAMPNSSTNSTSDSEERYLRAMNASLQNASPAASGTPSEPSQSAVTRVGEAANILAQGTQLPCVLMNRINTQQDGPVTCQVSRSIRSMDGSRVLVDIGTRMYGRYVGVDVRRSSVRIEWTRMLTPTGFSVTLSSPALDADGSVGVTGSRESHWISRLGATVMIGALSDAFKYLSAKNGPRTTAAYAGTVVESPFDSNTAQALQTVAAQTARESAENAPSVTVPQGTSLSVYVDRDIDFGPPPATG